MGDTGSTDYEPPIDTGDDSSEEDDGPVPTGLDDHTTEPEPEETEEPEDDDPSGTPGGTPVGGGGAGAGAAGAGAGAPTPTPEEPSSEEPDDDEESEPETPDQSETPEDDAPEQEPEQPERSEPQEPEDPDDHEQEDDDDDEEEQEAQIVVHSDAWDSIAWGIYPVRLQLKEEYGDQVQFDDRLVPVREFDFPEDRAQHWDKWEPRHGMPVSTEVWNENPPESTELANRAFAAAREQSIPLAKRFIRRLRTAAIVEGTNIEDREILLELARNVGLDTDQLEEDWEDVDLRRTSREVETPKITIHVDNETVTQPGLVTANDVKTPLKRAGLEANDPQSLPGFVDEHGPVAVKEVQQVYEYSLEEALDELQNAEGVVPVEYGETTLWTTFQ
jgi:predicted DsbA family dithiol-disulfide isomerase